MACTKPTNRGLSLDLSSPFSPHVSDLRSPEDINLNLYNFDKVDALNCPYVLTSPRSLEACANLGIKPVELLSKNFEEFRDELPSYTPFEEVKHLYKLFEIQRTSEYCSFHHLFIYSFMHSCIHLVIYLFIQSFA